MSDMTLLNDGALLMKNLHDVDECAGRGCWVHHPQDWALNAAPVFWSETQRRAYRKCRHGSLHRDLDDYEYATRYSTKWAGMPAWCCDESGCRCCR